MTEGAFHVDHEAAVAWLRQVSPYFRLHRGKTFVIYLDGQVLQDRNLANLIRDLSLLSAVGIRLVVVFGARPQIEQRLGELGISPKVVGELRVSDANTMAAVREVVGGLRLGIESAFSLSGQGGVPGGGRSRVASGNFVTARPAGIIDGVDLAFTGLVRNVDVSGIESCLARDDIVLLPPLGYSPTGELFNLKGKDLAAQVASELNATKLILVSEFEGISDGRGGIHRQLTVRDARQLRDAENYRGGEDDPLSTAIRACQLGVERAHIISRHDDGAILRELFTRDGVGTMVSNAPFDQLREARAQDVGGILELVVPLEEQGLLVKRSREKLESEVDHFIVMLRENTVVACGALYPYPEQKTAELACIAVHPDYRGSAFGDSLLDELERRARDQRFESVFVLTTQATQWFGERGYRATDIAELPVQKRALYNVQRNSAVLLKTLI